MKSKKILIVEDDPAILQGLHDLLTLENYQVISAMDGQEGLDLFQKSNPDLLILDVMLPRLDGYAVCREIRKQHSHVPILFLTAQNKENDQVLGLHSGGDDYISKPFGMQVLLARIEALFRRTQLTRTEVTLPESFSFGGHQVDRRQLRLSKGDSSLSLSKRELALIELFYQHPQEVLSREILLLHVWGVRYHETTRTLDQHIAQLRKKVEPDPKSPVYITTVHGMGYRYTPPTE